MKDHLHWGYERSTPTKGQYFNFNHKIEKSTTAVIYTGRMIYNEFDYQLLHPLLLEG